MVRPPWQQPDPDGLIHSIMKATSGRTPRYFTEIAGHVRDDFGSVTDRTIWRGLAKLVERGHLLRVELGLAFSAYIKPKRKRSSQVGRLREDEMREYMLSIVEMHPTKAD